MSRGGTSDSYDFLFKLLVIGAAGTGKSCLLHRFIDSRFKEYSSHTIGVEFGSRVVSLGARNVKLQIWDTAGQERFRSVTRSYYRGAAGALLVFDITSRESFLAAAAWLQDARALASTEIVVVLVGHKSDLEGERQVSRDEAEEFSGANGLAYLEASSLLGVGSEDAFIVCAREIIARIESGAVDPGKANTGVQFGNNVSLRSSNSGNTSSNGGRSVGSHEQCSC